MPVHHGGVRDDFPAAIKTELAKRVGFLCSNPACRQSTSGPQSAPRGTVNVGVAAHITAASRGGPRYEAGHSAQARSEASNGVWLCQTCAKLVDDDVPGHGADLLRRWKADAEQAAAAALTRRRSPPSTSEGVFLEAERLMPALIEEMRQDVQSDETELVRELVPLPSKGVAFGHDRRRFVYFETDHPSLKLQLDWLEEAGLIIDVTPREWPIYRMTAEFVYWLRTRSG